MIYSGSHDDDGGWSLLRLRKTETVSAPYIDVSAEEVDFEARQCLDQERIRPFFIVDKAKQIPPTAPVYGYNSLTNTSRSI